MISVCHISKSFLVTALLVPSVALAQEPPAQPATQPAAQAPSCGPDKPWFQGVTPEQQAQASALYKDGNLLLDRQYYREAGVKYRQALEHWDNPRIHYNLMIAMLGADDSIQAYESAVAASRYDGCALSPEQRHRAAENRDLLAAMLGWITVDSQVPGAQVFLDNELIFVGPGKATLLVRDGEHRVLATKKDHLTTHKTFKLAPRQRITVVLDMLRNDEAVLTSRRWQPWKPYAVLAAGVGVGLLGSAFQWRSSARNQQYSARFAEECPRPQGCMPGAESAELLAAESGYTWYRRVGIGTLTVSGAIAVGGIVLWYLNRPEKYPNPRRDKLVHLVVTPTFAPDAAGAAIIGSF